MTHINNNGMPRLDKCGDAYRLIVNERPFISLAGEVHNSSSSSLEYMNKNVWERLVYFNCNTAVIPVSWELIEPLEGTFDFTLVQGLIEGARKHNLETCFHLVRNVEELSFDVCASLGQARHTPLSKGSVGEWKKIADCILSFRRGTPSRQ